MNEPIGLSEFVNAERRRLWAFQRYWLRMNVDAPDVFPPTLFAGDWNDHFKSFQEGVTDADDVR